LCRLFPPLRGGGAGFIAGVVAGGGASLGSFYQLQPLKSRVIGKQTVAFGEGDIPAGVFVGARSGQQRDGIGALGYQCLTLGSAG